MNSINSQRVDQKVAQMVDELHQPVTRLSEGNRHIKIINDIRDAKKALPSAVEVIAMKS
jgi:hypothetical protein